MSKQRSKGTLAETALVAFLRERGEKAERRALHGTFDKGDINWLDWIALEVKNCRTPRYGEWVREAEEERRNAGAEIGVVVHKPHGTSITNQADWHVVMSLDTFLHIVQMRELAERDPVGGW